MTPKMRRIGMAENDIVYSSHVNLNWLRIYKTEGFKEVLMQFVVNLSNHIENCMAFTDAFHEKVSSVELDCSDV